MERSSRMVDFSWMKLVTDFTKRRLTNADDRLNAIHGIAVEFAAKASLNGYAFGMQETNFTSQLSWRVPSAGRGSNALRSTRAPTWSWVSVDSPVSFPLYISSKGEEKVAIQLLSTVGSDYSVLAIRGQVLFGWGIKNCDKDNTLFDTPDLIEDNPTKALLLLTHHRNGRNCSST